VAALAPGLAQAVGNKAVDAMRKSVQAKDQVTYSAVAAVRSNRGDPARRGTRQIVMRQRGGYERIKLLDAEGNLVWSRVCDGKTRWDYSPGRNHVLKVTVPPHDRELAKELVNLQALAANYRLTHEGIRSLAGRSAHQVSIVYPGPPPLLIRRVWIDSQKSMTLKSEHYKDDGGIMRSVAVERVNLDPTFPPGTFRFTPPEGVKSHEIRPPRFVGALGEAARIAGFSARTPTALPTGFVFYENHVAVRDYKSNPLLWLQFTNGVRTFSIFQRPAVPDDAAHSGERDDGGHRGTFSFRSGGFQITVVGPLTDDERQLIKTGYQH
jgi:outer membrane lipoprotein-sorting protein